MRDSLGLVEVGGWSPAMVILDAMEKTAWVRLIQTELNDQPGVILKVEGSVADVGAALDRARALAGEMQVAVVAEVMANPDSESLRAIETGVEVSPLIEQPTVRIPVQPKKSKKEKTVDSQAPYAIGFIETQGFTAVFEAIDTAVKTAAVEVLAREKLGGGFITVVIKGDVAAVSAAIDAGKARVEGLGKLIAAHVIASPSQSVMALLPKA